MNNPLFPNNANDDKDSGLVLPNEQNAINPSEPRPGEPAANPAADLIRQKLQKIYTDEPDAKKEAAEAKTSQHRSKHQEFMYKLSTSGKSLAEIQTEWHNYYVNLPDNEKHEVWQEFYESAGSSHFGRYLKQQPADQTSPAKPQLDSTDRIRQRREDKRTRTEIKQQILYKVSAGGKLKAKHHLQSLGFGLGLGSIVLVIFLFGFFNEVFIAPFIHPSQNAQAAPVIIGNSGVAPNNKNEVIIPKINVEIPVVYSQTTTDETAIENALENGVVHYPTTVKPGQQGNAAFFGHSSNNIFNPGKYKFAFVLLHTLKPGDSFYLTVRGKIYAYMVISRKIVEPNQVGVLGTVPGQIATATLITCDPPGTSLHRLVVVGQQVSPNPSTNAKAGQPSTTASSPTSLPSEGPTLLGRFFRAIFGGN